MCWQVGFIVTILGIVFVTTLSVPVQAESNSGTVTLAVGEHHLIEVDATEEETEIIWKVTVVGGAVDVFALDRTNLRLYEDGENFSVLTGLTQTNVTDDRQNDFVHRDRFYIVLDYSCTNCTSCSNQRCPDPTDPAVEVTYKLERNEVDGKTGLLYCGLCLGFAAVGAIVAVFRTRNEAREEAHDEDYEVVSLSSISSPSLIQIGGRRKKEPTPGQMEVWREAVRADFEDE